MKITAKCSKVQDYDYGGPKFVLAQFIKQTTEDDQMNMMFGITTQFVEGKKPEYEIGKLYTITVEQISE